jgi:hypothetical protein
MNKYMLKPCYIEDDLWEDQKRCFDPDLKVDDRKSTFTGLITPEGYQIYRTPEPFGFTVYD